MKRRIFVPGDAGAAAVGGDRVAAAITDAAKRAEMDIEIVRTGVDGSEAVDIRGRPQTIEGTASFDCRLERSDRRRDELNSAGNLRPRNR